MKVLECSSKGDKRFSAFYAMVKVNDVVASIEQHYQLSKRFDGQQLSMKEAKGKKPTSFVIGNKELPVELLSQWYKLLWLKYLVNNPDLYNYASGFDVFNDMFRGKSINCQADVIAEIVGKGSTVVFDDCRELVDLLSK